MVGNSNEDIRNTVAINIFHSGYGSAELATELLVLNHLKFGVIKLTYHAQCLTAYKENLSHILGFMKPRGTIKISILERYSDCEIGNSVTIDVTDDCDGGSKERRGIFR